MCGINDTHFDVGLFQRSFSFARSRTGCHASRTNKMIVDRSKNVVFGLNASDRGTKSDMNVHSSAIVNIALGMRCLCDVRACLRCRPGGDCGNRSCIRSVNSEVRCVHTGTP